MPFVNESRDAMFDLLLKMVSSNSSSLADPVKKTIVKYFDQFMGSDQSVLLVKEWLTRGQVFHPDEPEKNITKLNSRQ